MWVTAGQARFHGVVVEAISTKIGRTLSMCAVLLWFVAAASALDPHTLISQYAHTAWRMQDGFIGPAQAITQTTDGYIWIATLHGLYRFDGVKPTLWKSTDKENTPGGSIYHLLGARDGSLWMGATNGLSHLKDGHLTAYGPAIGSPAIGAILEDHSGRIWVTRYQNDGTGSLCLAKESTLECYGKKQGNPADFGLGIAEDGSGNIWFGGDRLVRWDHHSFTSYFNDHLSRSADEQIEDVAAGSSGEVWAALDSKGPKGGVQHFSNGKWTSYIIPGLDGRTIQEGHFYLDKRHTLWIATQSNGIFHVRDGIADHYGIADGLTGQNAGAMYEDREGNLWVVTDQGLDMFRDNTVITFSQTQGLSGPDVHAVLAVKGHSVWVGSRGGLDVIDAGTYSSIHHQKVPGQEVNSMFADSKDQVWLGIDDRIFVYGQGRYSEVKNADGSALEKNGEVDAFTEDTQGNIWALGSFSGGDAHEDLYLIRDRHVTTTIPLGNSLAAFLVSDRHAGIWTLSVDGQLVHLVNGHAEESIRLDKSQGNHSIDVDSRNALWATSNTGLHRWNDGQISTMDVTNGLPCYSLDSMIQDDHGSYWILSVCGILRITAEDWQRWLKSPQSQISPTHLSALDGAHFAEMTTQNQPAVARTRDGRLWFAVGTSVQMVDPNHSSNTVPPPVHIEEVVADHKTYESSDKLALPHLRGELEINYTAMSFKIPQRVHFRYKLEGQDEEWQEAGTRRQAFYNDLPPRKYRFHVIACNSDGVWNEVGASLDFSIRPAWYQTLWFRLCCVAAFLLLLWAAYLLRIRQLESQFAARLDIRVDERTRIARELHDTLLQSFQGALYQIQAARRLLLRNADNGMTVLDAAIGAASEGITEGRAAIHDLRPEPAIRRDLAELLNAVGRDLIDTQEPAAHPPSFRVTVEGQERSLALSVQDEIYRIACEMIRNAFHHAAANLIEVEIRYDEDHLRLRIRDDGKGMDPKILADGGRSGHWGIPGIRERAQRIESQLDFWSEKDAGTEAELTVPGAKVYEKRPNNKRFQLFRWKDSDGRHS